MTLYLFPNQLESEYYKIPGEQMVSVVFIK